jgi:hypothetical protein
MKPGVILLGVGAAAVIGALVLSKPKAADTTMPTLSDATGGDLGGFFTGLGNAAAALNGSDNNSLFDFLAGAAATSGTTKKDANTSGAANSNPAPIVSYGAGTAGDIALSGSGTPQAIAKKVSAVYGPATPTITNYGGNPLVAQVTTPGGQTHLIDVGGKNASASEREAARQANMRDLNARYGPNFIGY